MCSLVLVTFVAAIIAAGCGEGALSSPTGPSASTELAPVSFDAPSDLAASADDDTLAALGGKESQKEKAQQEREREREKEKNDRERGKTERSDDDDSDNDSDDDSDNDSDDDRHGRRRQVSGMVTAVGADSITIRRIAVRVTSATVIRHGHRRLTLAQIAVGDHAQAKGLLSADGRTFTASEIKVEVEGIRQPDASILARTIERE
jgi:hypothetical protein